MNDVIITTTNSIEGAIIEKYYGLVTSSLVIGTNIISDFIASFSDFFGGMSAQYRYQLELLYDRAVKDLTHKAMVLGANAILGTRLDFDEISGKGKSMFMVSISGTAVMCRYNKEHGFVSPGHLVSEEQLKVAQFIREWKLNNEKAVVTDDEWHFILGHNIPSIAEDLLGRHINAFMKGVETENQNFNKNFQDYFTRLDEERQISAIYGTITRIEDFGWSSVADEVFNFYFNIIENNHLFSPIHVLSLINDGHLSIAVPLLECDKTYYSEDDLNIMKAILNSLHNLPNKGRIEEVKGFLSTGGKKYICQREHKNNENEEFCSECGLNIKGLTQYNVRTIAAFSKKIETLENLLNSKQIKN